MSQLKCPLLLDVHRKVFKSILMKAQLQSHSLFSHEPYPLFYWALVHLQQAFISLSWAFIRTCLEIFNPLSQIWAYYVFITFGLSLFIHLSSFFFRSSPLARIYRSLPFKVYEFLIILGLSIQLGGPRLGNFIFSF